MRMRTQDSCMTLCHDLIDCYSTLPSTYNMHATHNVWHTRNTERPFLTCKLFVDASLRLSSFPLHRSMWTFTLSDQEKRQKKPIQDTLLSRIGLLCCLPWPAKVDVRVLERSGKLGNMRFMYAGHCELYVCCMLEEEWDGDR